MSRIVLSHDSDSLDLLEKLLVFGDVRVAFYKKNEIIYMIFGEGVGIYKRTELPEVSSDIGSKTLYLSSKDLLLIVKNKRKQTWDISVKDHTIKIYDADWKYNCRLESKIVTITPKEFAKSNMIVQSSFIKMLSEHLNVSKSNILKEKQKIISLCLRHGDAYLISTDSSILFISKHQIENCSVSGNYSFYVPAKLESLLDGEMSIKIDSDYLVLSSNDCDVTLQRSNSRAASLLDIIDLRDLEVNFYISSRSIKHLCSLMNSLKVVKRSTTISIQFLKDSLLFEVQSDDYSYTESIKQEMNQNVNQKILESSKELTINAEVFKTVLTVAKNFADPVFLSLSKDSAYLYIRNEQNDNIIVFTLI